MASEDSLCDWLKKGAKQLARCIVDNIENIPTSGWADNVVTYSGRTAWVELKYSKRPVRPTSKLTYEKVKPTQINWHRRYQLAESATFFLIQVGSGHKAMRYLVDGLHAVRLSKPITEAQLSELSICKPWATADYIIELVTDYTW